MIYDKDFYRRNAKNQAALFNAIGGIISGYRPRAVIAMQTGKRAVTQTDCKFLFTLIEFGCATGVFLAGLAEAGAEVTGLDMGTVPDEYLRIKNFNVVDLSKPVNFGKFDLAICLEVAEHLPEESAETLVDSITSASRRVLFSAAIPGQGGIGHLNEQPHEYWHDMFIERGYGIKDSIRPIIRGNKNVPFWYRNNIFMYERKK